MPLSPRIPLLAIRIFAGTLLFTLVAAARQPATGVIEFWVKVKVGKDSYVAPKEQLKVLAQGGGEVIVLWTTVEGLVRQGGIRRGNWKIAVKHKPYKQIRHAWVEVKSAGVSPANIEPIPVRKPTPTPTPQNGQGSLRAEPTSGARGANVVVVVYREGDQSPAQQPPAQASPTPEPSPTPRPRVDRNVNPIIEGTVTDSEGKVVPEAEASLFLIDNVNQRQSLVARVHTDRDGKFKLDSSRKTAAARQPAPEGSLTYLLHIYSEDRSYTLQFELDEVIPSTFKLVSEEDDDDAEEEEEGEKEDLIEAVEATRRHVFTPDQMEALPVPGFRSFDTFALLVPGVLPPPATFNTSGPGVSSGVGTPGIFTVNGMRSRENNFTIDGSDNNDEDVGTRRQGYIIPVPQAIESLQEFQVITALPDARFGRNIGGQINALTRSGEHGLHGSAYGFFTSDRFTARDFFDSTAGNGPPSFALSSGNGSRPVLLDGNQIAAPNPAGGKNENNRQQLGVAVGGRVWLTENFFFFSGEFQRADADRESHFAVPTVSQRGVFDTGATGTTLLNGQPIHSASLPGNAVFSLYPFPNNPLGPYGANTYTSVLPADGRGARFALKLDRTFVRGGEPRTGPWLKWLVSPPAYGDHLAGRYNFTDERSTIPVSGGAIFSALRPKVRTQNVSIYFNRKLSNRMSDALRLSFGRTRLFFGDRLDPTQLSSGLFPDRAFLLNAPLLLNLTTPGTAETTYVSAASLQGRAALAALGLAGVTTTEEITGPLGQVIIPGFSPVGVDVDNFPQERANNTIQMADTLTYTRGAHLLTFGFDVRKTQINSTLDRNFRPLAVFGGLRRGGAAPLPIRLPGGTLPDQRFLSGTTLAAAGVPTGLFHTLARDPNSTIGIRYTQVNLFFQDAWQLRQDFRVMLGGRYELNTVPDTVGKRVERAFDPDELRRQIQEAAAGCVENVRCQDITRALNSALPTGFKVSFGSDRNDFDFRLGFVYDPGNTGQFAIRGGIGSYSGQFPGYVLSQSRNALFNFIPLNYAGFPPGNTPAANLLFNLANPRVRALALGFNAVAAGTLNTASNPNLILMLANLLSAAPGQGQLNGPLEAGLNLALPQSELRTPYSFQYGATIEGELPGGYVMSAAYVGTRGIKLLRVSTPNLGPLHNRVSFTGVTPADADHPFPVFTGFNSAAQRSASETFTVARTLFENSASSTYNSLQGELRKRYSQNFQFGIAFTYSHSIDDASDFVDSAGAFALPQNSLARSERGPSSFDARLRLVSHFVLDIDERLLFLDIGKKLGGWQIAGVITNQTGQPYTVNSAFDINRDGNLTDRLNTTSGLIFDPAGAPRVRLRLAPGISPFDLLAPAGQNGAVGRNTFRANGIANFDLAVSKFFYLNDDLRLTLRTEVFNLFNRTHFAIPERILESPAFGSSTRTALPARTVQFALRFTF
jgi:hypothetical protein